VRRSLGDGIELDDDPARVDVSEVHRFLVEEAYWVRERPRDVVERTIAEATRVLGAYAGDRQIGFARALSDRVSFAYLDDVYVLAEYRGRGIGAALVDELVNREPLAGLNWLLFTADAHAFYRRLGFGPCPGHALMRSRSPGTSPRSAPGPHH
jgi:GNAT superfamily N-acetyltransferase